MAPRKNNDEAKTALPVESLPPGTKRVTVNKKEEYVEQPSVEETELQLKNEELEFEPEQESVELEEALSPVQSFLLSLRERAGSGDGTIRIYAIRKPDPVGLAFRNPCNNEYTAGDVPYDETDLSIEALEVAIQKLYGGGRYQIKVRQNGTYQGAITRNIRDLPEQQQDHRRNGDSAAYQHPPQNQPFYQPPEQPHIPAQPQKSPREELREVLDLAKDIAGIRGNNQQPQARELPPSNPMDVVKETFSLIETMQTSIGKITPAATGGERNWVDSAAVLIEKSRFGDLFFSVGNMIAQVAIQHRMKTAAESANGKKADTETTAAPQAPTKEESPSPAALTAAPSPPVEEAPDLQPEAPQPSPAEMEVLEYLVDQMRLYEQEESTDKYDEFLQRVVTKVKTLPAEMLVQVAAQPSVFLLIYLAQLRPEWADVADLHCGTEFIGDLKQMIGEDEQGTAGESNADEKTEVGPQAAQNSNERVGSTA